MTSKEKKNVEIDQDSIDRLVEDEILLRRCGNLKESQLHAEQQELYGCWEKDVESLDVINSSLVKTDTLTGKMLETLKTFDNRVHSLLASINHVQKQTDVWKRLHTNINRATSEINKTIDKFDKVDKAKIVIEREIEYFAITPRTMYTNDTTEDESDIDLTDLTDVSSEETTTETEEPSTEKSSSSRSLPYKPGFTVMTNTSNLDTYLENLDLVVELEKYFIENKNFKSSSHTLETLSRLISTGMNNVSQYFNKVLNLNNAPLEIFERDGSITIMRKGMDLLCGQGLESYIEPNKRVIQLLDEHTIANLQKAIKRLQAKGEHKNTSYLDSFIEKRSSFLLQTIQNNFNKQNVLSHAFHADKKSQKSDKFTLTNLNPMKLLVNDDKEVKAKEFIEASAYTYERGTHRFLFLLKTLLVLIRAERVLVDTLLEKNPSSHFAKIVEPTFHYFGELSEELLAFQERTPNRIYGISVILDIYSVFKGISPYFDAVLSRNYYESTTIMQFWTKITTCGKQIFQTLQEDVQNDPSRTIPLDANVHELTSKCFNFLLNLFNYKEFVRELLPPIPNTRPTSYLGNYVIVLIDSLKDNLILKTKRERKSVLSIVFLINNFYFIWDKVSNTPLGKEVGASLIANYKSWFQEQVDIYRSTWDRLLTLLKGDDIKESKKEKGGLSKKSKQAIKYRFKSVNSEVMDTYNEQARFYIANEQLRKDLRSIVIKTIVPQYQAFIARYSDVEFTKSPEKYMKIDMETLESMLSKFFGGHLKGSLKETNLTPRDAL